MLPLSAEAYVASVRREAASLPSVRAASQSLTRASPAPARRLPRSYAVAMERAASLSMLESSLPAGRVPHPDWQRRVLADFAAARCACEAASAAAPGLQAGTAALPAADSTSAWQALVFGGAKGGAERELPSLREIAGLSALTAAAAVRFVATLASNQQARPSRGAPWIYALLAKLDAVIAMEPGTAASLRALLRAALEERCRADLSRQQLAATAVLCTVLVEAFGVAEKTLA